MHTFGETNTGVPAFLAKLWRLVEDGETNSLIYWSADGKSFIIQNQAQFAREILPQNYKHNNMASFIRQLNMYGFHKITSLDGGGLKFDRDDMEFSHPCFQRDNPYLLEHIKRKISTAKTTNNEDKSILKAELVTKVLHEVKTVKGRQDSLDNRFVSMKQENEALWREVAILRQKHMKQQQIVNKLIQFLVTIVQPQRGTGIGNIGGMGGVKRRFQLMINDVPDGSKPRKSTRTSSNSAAISGPVIRELSEGLLDYEDPDEEGSLPYITSPGFQNTPTTDEIDEIEDADEASVTYEDNTNLVDDSDQIIYENAENIATPTIVPNAGPSTSAATTFNEPLSYVIESIDDLVSSNDATTTNKPIRQYQLRQQQQQPQEPTKVKIMPARNAKQIASSGAQRPIIISGKQQAFFTPKSTAGKSLLNTQRPVTINVAQQQQQQPIGIKNISNVITVPSAQKLMPSNFQGKQLSTNTIAAAQKKPYTSKDDFISEEMPTDLFGDGEQDDSLNQPNLELSSEAADEILSDNDILASGTFGNTTQKTINDGASSSGSDGKRMAITKYCKTKDEKDIMRLNSHDQLNQHLDGVQNDLESIKEYLKNEDYSLDANTLLGNSSDGSLANRIDLMPSLGSESLSSVFTQLFGDIDVLQNYSIPMNPELQNVTDLMDREQTDASGSELIQYQPTTPIDFTDFLNIEDEPTASNSIANANDQNDGSAQEENTNTDLATPYIKSEQFAFPKK